MTGILRAGVRVDFRGVSSDVLVGVSVFASTPILAGKVCDLTRTRSYIVVAAKDIRQIPGPVLDDDFIAGLFEALEVYGFEIVGERIGGRVNRVTGVFGVELKGRVKR